jgi:hypothetical protein
MSATRSSLVRRFAALLLLAAAGGATFRVTHAQSLADVAKKEEARRKTIPAAAKVYTNKDLNAQAGDTPPPAAATPAKAGDAAGGDKVTKDKEPAGKDKEPAAKDKEPAAKDKAYWSGRLKALQDQVDRDEAYALAMQTRVNSLTADFVNRDDPAQRTVIERDRQKALADLGRLKQSVADGKKAIGALEEDARRAGVPPGWLR